MKITAEMVLAQAPEVAEQFRAEGAKSVKITAENVPQDVADSFREEGKKSAQADLDATAKAKATEDERARITAIQDLVVAGSEGLAKDAIAKGHTPEQFAVAMIKEGKAKGNSTLEAFRSAETQTNVPATPSSSGQRDGENPQAAAAASVEALRKAGIIDV